MKLTFGFLRSGCGAGGGERGLGSRKGGVGRAGWGPSVSTYGAFLVVFAYFKPLVASFEGAWEVKKAALEQQVAALPCRLLLLFFITLEPRVE